MHDRGNRPYRGPDHGGGGYERRRYAPGSKFDAIISGIAFKTHFESYDPALVERYARWMHDDLRLYTIVTPGPGADDMSVYHPEQAQLPSLSKAIRMRSGDRYHLVPTGYQITARGSAYALPRTMLHPGALQMLLDEWYIHTKVDLIPPYHHVASREEMCSYSLVDGGLATDLASVNRYVPAWLTGRHTFEKKYAEIAQWFHEVTSRAADGPAGLYVTHQQDLGDRLEEIGIASYHRPWPTEGESSKPPIRQGQIYSAAQAEDINSGPLAPFVPGKINLKDFFTQTEYDPRVGDRDRKCPPSTDLPTDLAEEIRSIVKNLQSAYPHHHF